MGELAAAFSVQRLSDYVTRFSKKRRCVLVWSAHAAANAAGSGEQGSGTAAMAAFSCQPSASPRPEHRDRRQQQTRCQSDLSGTVAGDQLAKYCELGVDKGWAGAIAGPGLMLISKTASARHR
jgi:hypothetical protein